MKTFKCDNLEDAKEKLQDYIDINWHIRKGRLVDDADRRQWFKAIPKDSYDEPQYRVELWVLEGSPVKQIVIINHRMFEIICHDGRMIKEAKFTWEHKHN